MNCLRVSWFVSALLLNSFHWVQSINQSTNCSINLSILCNAATAGLMYGNGS